MLVYQRVMGILRLYDHLPTEKLGHCSPRRFCWIGITLNVHDPWAIGDDTGVSIHVEMGNSTKYGYLKIEKMMIGCGWIKIFSTPNEEEDSHFSKPETMNDLVHIWLHQSHFHPMIVSVGLQPCGSPDVFHRQSMVRQATASGAWKESRGISSSLKMTVQSVKRGEAT